MKNKGQCYTGVLKNKAGKLEKCAFCVTLTRVHCAECKIPLCQTHVKVFTGDDSSSPSLLCEE